MDKSVPHRKRKTNFPCNGCGLHQQHCICAHIPKLELKTRLLLLIHHKELKRTTNTGRLALAALSNSKMMIRGLKDHPIELKADITRDYQSVVFFPAPDSIELSEYLQTAQRLPLQLIVPDGNWRQASKVPNRHAELKNLPRVKITNINPVEYQLRKEHLAEGMSTLEAIAKAIELIEGTSAGAALRKLYHAKLRATLLARGTFFDPETLELLCKR